MLGFIIFGVIKYNLDQSKVEKLLKEYSVKYPPVKYQDPINSTVVHVFFGDPSIFRRPTYVLYVSLSNNKNYTISAVTNYGNQHLVDKLKTGSTVIKDTNSSTFRLIDKTKQDTIVFQLLDKQGEPITIKED